MKYPIFSDINYFGLKQSTGKSRYISALSVAFFLSIGMGTTVSAQIVPDNTLPNNSVLTTDVIVKEALADLIEGGTVRDNNLFHSFLEFNVSDGARVYFASPDGIANILTRVTGNNLSQIFGTLGVDGGANLFLLNPNGIIFGENAALDIRGSFLGSTANSLKFSDGSEFSAVNPQDNPLLTVSIPIGLQYGTNNGDIVVQGTGNQLEFNPDFTVNKDSRPTGLQVDTGQTLALVGGNVFVEGGNLTAESGSVELGSVTDNSLVKLISSSSGWSLDYSEVSNFQDIYLALGSSIDVSGNSGGDVNLQGREVIITDGSAILADTLGDRDGGRLGVSAAEFLVVAGTSAEQTFISRLSTDVAPGATGNGGDIELKGGNVIIADGAQVLSSTYSSGNTGNISVQANDVELISGSRILDSSGIFTLVFGSGNGGEIDIEANNIFVWDGAQAAALTFGDGGGGNLNVKANNIELTGISPGGEFSSIFSTNTFGAGKGGDLTIDSEYLLVAGGGQVQSSVFSSGDGGNLLVKANQVELISGAPGVGASGLFANVEPGATGSAGKLAITSESVFIADGAQAVVSTFGTGDAGILEIKANEIELVGTSPGGFSSGLFSNAEPEATGNGGLIDLKTQNLTILNGAQVATTTFGLGQGGSIQVQANEIGLVGNSSNSPSGLFSGVEIQAEGSGGNVSINTESLELINGAQIAVSTKGFGNGGELNITANQVELIGSSELGASGIFGNAIVNTGDGGNIRITTNSLNIQDSATISASNFSSSGNDTPGQGKAGNIFINANSLKLDRTDSEIPSSITAATNAGGGGEITLNIAEEITLNNNSQITAETLGSANGGMIAITTKNLNLNSQGQISTSSSGLGQAGNINITAAEEINTNQGSITASSTQSGGGNINLTTYFMSLENNSLISTSVSDSTGGGGNINLDARYIIVYPSQAQGNDIIASAEQGQGGKINITTQALFGIEERKATPGNGTNDIDASSEFGLDGEVAIKRPESDRKIGVVQLQNKTTESTELLTANCVLEQENTLIVTGKGGLSENPSQYLRTQSVWEDLRHLSHDNNIKTNLSAGSFSQPTEQIIEAEGWTINSQGNIELVTSASFNQCRK